MKISVIIPAFNEEENIPVFYVELIKTIKKLSYEIIFINDGSKDNTLKELKRLSSQDKNVKIISLSRNFGHQAALTAGLESASGDLIISMDADLQDPPEVILEMIEKWKEGNKIVYARRLHRVDGFFKKYTAIWYYKLLSFFSQVDIPRNVGDFRLIDRVVLDHLLQMNEQARYLRGMVAWLGFKYAFVDFSRPERIHGETNYTFRKMVRLAMDGILNFSFAPLRIGFLLGILAIYGSLLFFAYMVFDTMWNDTVYPLYKWLIVIIFGFIGLQFIFMWILGEYIGRIYDDVRKRHIYVIEEKVGF